MFIRKNPAHIFVSLIITCAVTAITACTHNTQIVNLDDIPHEINKRFAARSGCNCAAFSMADNGNFYKVNIITKEEKSCLKKQLTFSRTKNFLPQSISYNCRYISIVGFATPTRTDVFIYDRATQKLDSLTIKFHGSSSYSAFSNIGLRLAYISDGQIKIYDLQNHKDLNIPVMKDVEFKYITWSSNSKFIYAEDKNTNIYRYELNTGNYKSIWQSPGPFQGIRYITPSQFDDDEFYFVSDFNSEFRQIYKYSHGKVTIAVNSNHDKFLLQRPISDGYLYFRSDELADFKLKRYKNGVVETVLGNGVIYDFCANVGDIGLATYTNPYNSPSIFKVKNNKAEALFSINKPDTISTPISIINRDSIIHFVYMPHQAKKWIVWLHGGPRDQYSNRYYIYVAALVKAGYGVIAFNYPGSIGFGHKYELTGCPTDSILPKQVSGMHNDLSAIRSKFHINKYSIVGLSYGTCVGRYYVKSFKSEVLKYVELSGINASNYRLPVPTLYIYGENDPAMGDKNRVKMMNNQLKLSGSEVLSVPIDNHVILDRLNVSKAINKMANFLNK